MPRTDAAKGSRADRIRLRDQEVDYRLVLSKTARQLRVRVGPEGVEVVQPQARARGEVRAFLRAHGAWIIGQLERTERLRAVRKSQRRQAGEILFRGVPTPVRIEDTARRRGANQVVFDGQSLVVVRGRASQTTPAKTLESWLRKQARTAIEGHLGTVTRRLKRYPRQVYIMGQRTKWGNCSPLQNLSFNWRLIMAPEFVLRYLVTHEAAHLAVPDHSKRFWLTVQSLCPEMERAKQWLCANGTKLQVVLPTSSS